MKNTLLILLGLTLFWSCAAYKELKPEPKLSAASREYIELKNDDELFELDKDKKYFIAFPSAPEVNYYLVLDIPDKAVINSYLTDTFDDGKGRIVEIKDESDRPNTRSVYAVDNSVQNFYWVIDLVKRDFELSMTYRYVEQWRYKYENRAAAFKQTFEENKIDSSGYMSLGSDMNLAAYDFDSKISRLQKSSTALVELEAELNSIAAIFPVSIKNTTDAAYQDFLTLKNKLETEIKFQDEYLFVLTLFKNSSGPATDFTNSLPDYLHFFGQREKYPRNVSAQLASAVGSNLPRVADFYSKQLRAKSNSKAIDIPVDDMQSLVAAADILPAASFNKFASFVSAFNQRHGQISAGRNKLESIKEEVKSYGKMPSNTYFGKVITKLKKLQYNLPKGTPKKYGSYGSYSCVNIQNRDLNKLRRETDDLLVKYRLGEQLVPQINRLKASKNYGAMLGLIKKNKHLPFLKSLYKDLDKLALNDKKAGFNKALKTGDWSGAESALRDLARQSNFLNPKKSTALRNQMARTYNDTLFNRIDRISLQNARQLMNSNIETTENVEALYADPAFLPVHEPVFSARGSKWANNRLSKLKSKLNSIKEDEFPHRAITKLYDDFIANPNANGIMKARAVVVHGNHYKGANKKIKMRVGECDPWASKWITKAKQYRKVFALPSTTNPGGVNTYVFRVNVRIPSRAKFPVYDLNFKLPKEVAKSAGEKQWYSKILLNKKVVKNEGRYTVTAPTAANGYEFQITPVRMLAEGDNILEVQFKHNSFKALPVSVMAQKPIIKKH